MLRGLPTVDPQGDTEDLHVYGTRVLAFVLDTGVTATLADRDLELAEWVAMFGCTAPGISAPARQRLTDTRHRIARVLSMRADDRKLAMAPATVPPTHDIAGGTRVPLQPVLRVQPPAPARAIVPADVPF